MFDIDRRSVSGHADKHLNIENAAIQRILEEEAKRADAHVEEGIQGVLRQRVYLSSALDKAYDALLDNKILVEPKDAVAIIAELQKLDSKTEQQALEKIRIEFFAYLQAMKEVVPSETWERINTRTRELINQTPKALAAGENAP
jgi:hypothetical protein